MSKQMEAISSRHPTLDLRLVHCAVEYASTQVVWVPGTSSTVGEHVVFGLGVHGQLLVPLESQLQAMKQMLGSNVPATRPLPPETFKE